MEKPSGSYKFGYVRGAMRASSESGFEPLYDFPDFRVRYESSELFPLFKNRLLSKSRADFPEYLRQLNLTDVAAPLEILSVGGGNRTTDSFEVFPKIERRPDGAFRCRFLLHGGRYSNKDAQRRLTALLPNEKLYIAIELTNPVAQMAVQIMTEDYYVIGWAPRYLVNDLI